MQIPKHKGKTRIYEASYKHSGVQEQASGRYDDEVGKARRREKVAEPRAPQNASVNESDPEEVQMKRKMGESCGRLQCNADREEPNSNFWSAIVLTSPLSVGIVRSLGVTSSYAERRIREHRWERRGVGSGNLHLWRAKRSRRGRWWFILEVVVLRRIIADESAGRSDLGPLALCD